MLIDPLYFEPEARRRFPRWPIVLVAALAVIGVMVLLLWQVQVPYFAMSPGPVEEVSDLITVDEQPVYESRGDLYLLTVGLREVNVFEFIEAELDRETDLISRDVIRPPGVTQEQVTRRNLESMDESIDTAIYVALSRLGYEVGFSGEGAEVLEIVEGTPADGTLQVGDLITAVAGTGVMTAEEAADVIRSFEVGDTITLSGTRGDEPLEVAITLAPHPDIEGAPLVGVVFDTRNLEMELPVSVRVDSRNIGGPSAGLMYTLALIDLLTENDLTSGHRVAGTGTIRFDETVGAIGGVRQKVFAARGIGAEYVLVPQDNYEDALTAAGDDIEVVSVGTLQDALDFLEGLEQAPVGLTASG